MYWHHNFRLAFCCKVTNFADGYRRPTVDPSKVLICPSLVTLALVVMKSLYFLIARDRFSWHTVAASSLPDLAPALNALLLVFLPFW